MLFSLVAALYLGLPNASTLSRDPAPRLNTVLWQMGSLKPPGSANCYRNYTTPWKLPALSIATTSVLCTF
jgi:hypothetical protein